MRAPAIFTSREFNQDSSRAKKAADEGPVFITDRGRPSYVLLTVAEFERLTHPKATIVDLLAMPDAPLIDFEPPRLEMSPRPADLG